MTATPHPDRLPLAGVSGVRRAIGGYVRRQRALTITTIALAAAAALAGLVAPWAVGLIVDAVLGEGDRTRVLVLVVWVAGAGELIS